MVSDGLVFALLLLGLLWLYGMLLWAWPGACVIPGLTPRPAPSPSRQRAGAPTPCPGLPYTPPGAACEQAAQAPATPGPPAPLPRIISHQGRPRHVDTAQHVCPSLHCAEQGGVGDGTLHAKGHPTGGPWRQWHCTACTGSCLEPHGTPLHGKRGAPETCCIERVTRPRRPPGAAGGRRVLTLGGGSNAWQGAVTRWQPRTPALAAGLTAHVWTRCERLLWRVPPWPQPQQA